MKKELIMKRIFTLIFLCVLCTALFAKEDEMGKSLGLELTADSRTLRIGQAVTVKLKITGQDIARIITDVNNITFLYNSKPEFLYQFSFRPPVEGDCKMGPYSLSFNGKNLVSNQLTIKVLPEWNGSFGTFFRTDCNEIKLGDSFELVMETWSKERTKADISLQHKTELASIVSSVSTSQISAKNNEEQYYLKKSWLITPKSAGDFLITKDLFREFPDDIKPPQLTVHVKKENEK